MYVVLVLSCMCWHTVYWTSLYRMINVARGPEGHTVLCKRNNNNHLKTSPPFQHVSLLPVSQDLDHLGLKACEATFKNHLSCSVCSGAVGSNGNLHTESNSCETAVFNAGATSCSFTCLLPSPSWAAVPKLFCKLYIWVIFIK